MFFMFIHVPRNHQNMWLYFMNICLYFMKVTNNLLQLCLLMERLNRRNRWYGVRSDTFTRCCDVGPTVTQHCVRVSGHCDQTFSNYTVHATITALFLP